MAHSQLKEVNPVLPVPDIGEAVRFYTERLGFKVAFRDCSDPENYVGVRRGGVELHLQFHRKEDIPDGAGYQLRFIVDDPDALFEEYRAQGVLPDRCQVADKPWGTREFGLYDPNGHALVFYRDL